MQDPGGAGMGRHNNSLVHPFAFPARGNHAGATRLCKLAQNLGLALGQNFHETADAHLSSVHEVKEPEPGAVGEATPRRLIT